MTTITMKGGESLYDVYDKQRHIFEFVLDKAIENGVKVIGKESVSELYSLKNKFKIEQKAA